MSCKLFPFLLLFCFPSCFRQTFFWQAGKGGELTHDETTIIAGALELTEKTASDAMTPISDTFVIDVNAKLDRSLHLMMSLVCLLRTSIDVFS